MQKGSIFRIGGYEDDILKLHILGDKSNPNLISISVKLKLKPETLSEEIIECLGKFVYLLIKTFLSETVKELSTQTPKTLSSALELDHENSELAEKLWQDQKTQRSF